MDEQAIVRRHRGLGIASFVVSLAVLLLFFAGTAMATLLYVSRATTPAPTLTIITGFSLMFLWAVSLVGIGLGIAGAIDRTSKKVFPVLGIVFGAVTALVGITFMVVGLLVKGPA